jgi:putative salt-induced outer membrane protein
MNKTKLTASTCLLTLVSSMPLMAAEPASEETAERNWKAAAELGYVETSGNSETENLNAKLYGSIAYNAWEHALHLETLNSSSNDVRSAERYLANGQSDYFINERTYALGVATWEKDKFDGFDHQASVALGLGYKVIQDADMQLSVELAPGYRYSKLESGDKEEDAIIRVAETFSWKLTENSTLDQTFSTEAGDSNTVTRFGAALTSQVAGDLSMKVGYYLKHNSDVADGKDKTDRETSVTLVYKI